MTVAYPVLAQTDVSIPLVIIGTLGVAFIVVLWSVFATARARAQGGQEEAYRRLAEEATRAQERTAEALEQATAELAKVREQTAEIDKVLKQVD